MVRSGSKERISRTERNRNDMESEIENKVWGEVLVQLRLYSAIGNENETASAERASGSISILDNSTEAPPVPIYSFGYTVRVRQLDIHSGQHIPTDPASHYPQSGMEQTRYLSLHRSFLSPLTRSLELATAAVPTLPDNAASLASLAPLITVPGAGLPCLLLVP
jgi:hypothetical protein